NTPLFLLYLAMYRVPFINSNAYWEDRLPYKHFSKLYIRIWKDFIQPFSDKLYLQWKAKMDVNSKENPILYSNVSHRGEKKILELSLEFTGNLPGLILVRNSENQWMIERDHESD
ncbi:MAG: hypothetical protein KDK45_23765, partial [Leptospiraceae bacterium]|nr:hypothetical protein [Leptospiraceae bacterium]